MKKECKWTHRNYNYAEKLFLKMKLTFAIFFAGIMGLNASSVYSQKAKLSLDLNNVKISEVLKSIENQSEFVFIYEDEILNIDNKVSLQVKKSIIDNVLSKVFEGTDIAYEIHKKQVVLTKKVLKEIPGVEPKLIKEIQKEQKNGIRGIVHDEGGNPIPGVSVVIKGTTIGTVTNVDGEYTLNSIPDDAILLFSFVGMKTQEVPVRGKTTINVILKEDSKNIDEVVVTALGIKREEKSLGYAFTKVNGDDVNRVKSPNMMTNLAGKVPGLIISQTAGGPTGSSRVVVRGNTSISGDNQPLYVIDGVPVINTNDGNTGSGKYASGYDMGDVASSINPEDIESISVLKGPSAAALYGSLASNGVIMITMKKGVKKDLGIEFNSTTDIIKQGTHYDDVQTIYGQGVNGSLPEDITESQSTTFYNWGPRLDPNINVIGWDGVERPYALVKDNIDGFFKIGKSFNNSIALSQYVGKTGIRISYTNYLYDDIVPKTRMDRNTFNLNTNTQIRKLTVGTRIVYMHEFVKNRPSLADGYDNIAKSFFGLANNIDQAVFKECKDEKGEYLEWGGGQYNYNPYWVINEMKNETTKTRFFGALNLTYDFTKWLNLKVSGSTDERYLEFEKYNPVTTPQALTGELDQIDRKTITRQADVMLSFEKELTNSIRMTARVGANYFCYENDGFDNTYTDMTVKDVISPNSYTEKSVTAIYSKKEKNSIYGILALSYKNYLFIDGTIRRDASSTLPVKNNTYCYPSLSGSFVFTDAIKTLPSFISFGKLRVSGAEVGSDTSPYMLDLNYGLYSYTFNGEAAGSISTTTIPNKELKPTRTRSFETGLAMRFFKNRLGFDFSYYTSTSRDQINTVAAPYSSGYSKQIVNAGSISNKGVELAINGTPVSTSNFKWDINVNFSRNVSNIESLAEGLSFLTLASARWCGVSVVAKPGQPYGAIMGYNYQKDPNGNIILDKETLLPLQSEEREIIGNGTFDWTGGIMSAFSYKRITLNTTIDIKYGADIFSMTNLYSVARGQSKKTLEGRDEWIQSELDREAAGMTSDEWLAAGNQKGYVPKGVVESNDGTYVTNEQGINPTTYWQGYVVNGGGVSVPFIYDASYIKFREISVSYDIPQKLLRGTGISSVVVGLVSRNPWIIRKHVPNIDPDSNYYNGNGQGLEYGSLPSRKSFGFNLKVKL